MYCYTSIRSLAAALLLVSLSTTTLCQNIDTAQPILRQAPDLDSQDAYFGYTLALHQTANNPSSRTQALNGARIIVSAPKATVPSSSVSTTGAVYECPVNMGACSGLPDKLFDTTPNGDNENKADQFLGASMHSNDERFVVCAHRYARIFMTGGNNPSPAPLPLGICFYTEGRALDNFQEFVPCSNNGVLDVGGVGVCQAGTSSVFAPQGTLPSSSYALGVGAPGISRWRGAVIRRSNGGDVRFQSTSGSSESDSYQGYAITSGKFLTNDREDFAVSLPKRNLYFGSVNLVRNRNDLALVSQPLQGMQMGEYYGFSLLAADLDNNGFDDLLVGAPLYRANSTEPETGRVYLYRNTGGNFEFVRTIEGRMRYSRFGYAMANVGDINDDGFEDVAISAPFTETGTSEPGTVFIYHGTRTNNLLLDTEPSQIIRGSDLSLTQDLTSLRGFGTSLASGVDVDNNQYDDLLVGSFLSQQAFLLRTRPLARVTTTVSSIPPIVDVATTSMDCMLNGVAHACFTVRVCATYTGRGLMNTLDVTYMLSGDTQNVERRIIFDANNVTTASRSTTINMNDAAPGSCEDFTAYVRNPINDIFNPFIIELSVETPTRTVTPGNGNETPDDLSTAPVVTILGSRSVQVETLKQCSADGDDDCVPDLRISVGETRISATDQSRLNSIVAGFTSSVEIFLTVENVREDAFQADLSFVLPTNILELVNVFNITSNGEVSLNCDPPEVLVGENNEPQNMERHTCSIGNPFSGPGTIQLRVQLNPRVGLVGSEGDVSLNFAVSSINPEMMETINDNSVTTQLSVEASAEVSIDDGVVTPAQISYSETAPIFDDDNPLRNVSQLGAPVDVSFLIRNTGPSRVPMTEVEILWPLNSTLTGENFYLYITSIQSTGAASVTCTPEYINPLGLEGDITGDQEGGGDPTVSMGTGRRKKRSTIRSTRRKRQELMPEEVELSENVTLSCASAGPILNCVRITCTLFGLSGFGSTQIDINSRLDERFFSTNNDRYVFIPTASVRVLSDFIDSPETSASAQIRIIPAARVQVVGEATPVPWWAIVFPIAAALIVITVVAVLLWVFGFFRRRKHEEIKQRREELQNLQDNGVTPGGPDDEAL